MSSALTEDNSSAGCSSTDDATMKTAARTDFAAIDHRDGDENCADTIDRRADNNDARDEANAAAAEHISFKLAFGRQMYDISAPASQKVSDFMNTVQQLTNVTPAMQKLVCRGGKLNVDQTLADSKVIDGSKVLLIGSTMEQIVSANTKPSTDDLKRAEVVSASKEPLSKQRVHAKIIEQGIPDDVMPGERLPQTPLKGMRNKYGRSVRLTFKLEEDQLWIGTPERTEKLPLNTISDIVSEAIDGIEEYSIIGIGIGSTEASRVWVYWVPSQYVEAIRKSVMD